MYLRIAALFLILLAFFGYVISLDCYKCRSDVEPQCSTKPGIQIEVVECLDTDKCVVAIFDGVTHRGCLSTLIPSKYCERPLCRACDIPLCNDGIFPEDRLKCYQCSGAECFNVTHSKLQPKACPYYMEKDRCYTNIVSIHNIVRGCVSKDEEKCVNICLKCNYDGCNTEQGVFNSTCQSCSFMPGLSMYPKNYGCKRPQSYNESEGTDKCFVKNCTNTCTQKVLLGHKEKCFTYWNAHVNTITRGCSTRMGHFPTGKLWECYGDNCNSDCIDMRCNICDSETNSNCRNNTRYLRDEECTKGSFACYSCEDKIGSMCNVRQDEARYRNEKLFKSIPRTWHLIYCIAPSKNEILTRGCGFQETTSDRKCYQCYDEDGCNKNNTRTCYRCSSTKDSSCSDWKNITKIEHELCMSYDEKCVTITTDLYTVRGCESTISECTEADPRCQRCTGSLCNSGALVEQAEYLMDVED